MITDRMKLNSKVDARQWASSLGLESDDQIDNLADWIWVNRPFMGCAYSEHPIQGLSDEEFFNIADGAEQ